MMILERAVLALLIEHHPAHLATEEIVRALTVEADDLDGEDGIQNALAALRACGLLHSHGRFWFATLAAVRFEELERESGT